MLESTRKGPRTLVSEVETLYYLAALHMVLVYFEQRRSQERGDIWYIMLLCLEAKGPASALSEIVDGNRTDAPVPRTLIL